ncbi:hypothetical protein DA803_02980 [[Mycoplasma] phocae]|uniref:Variable surface lipoprotein n=1 Tax=[Mycoplasma] phocae TaxID=142651 RepID=A0A2Z5IQB3_9BACT|nr:variable surface lipoprotein [[Mycoplasma] phocae]AXE61033.1 hypothetical protein DA803_02980 [[Mycoplasma] phocae]
MKKKNFKLWIVLPVVVATMPLIAASCGKTDNIQTPPNPSTPAPDTKPNPIPTPPKQDPIPSPIPPKPNPIPTPPKQDPIPSPTPPTPMPDPNKKDMNNNKRPEDDIKKEEMKNLELLKLKREILYINLHYFTYQRILDLFKSVNDIRASYDTEEELKMAIDIIDDKENENNLKLAREFIDDFIAYKNGTKNNFEDDFLNFILPSTPSIKYSTFLNYIINRFAKFVDSAIVNQKQNDYGIYIFIKIWDQFGKINDESFYSYLNLYEPRYQLQQYISKGTNEAVKTIARDIFQQLGKNIKEKVGLSKNQIGDIDNQVAEIKKILIVK